MQAQVKKIEHRNQPRWAIIMPYPYHEGRKQEIKKLPGSKYSNTHKCWYLPYTSASYYALAALPWVTSMPPLSDEQEKNEDKTTIDTTGYIIYCKPEKRKTPIQTPIQTRVQKLVQKQAAKRYQQSISPFWIEMVAKYKIYLHNCRYSDNTVNSYMTSLMLFLAWWGDRSIDSLTLEQLYMYNDQTFVKKNLSRSAQTQWVSAMRLFLKDNPEIDIDGADLERPRMASYLPNILSENEVKKLIGSYINFKHKTIITMYYACGMRTSELLDLKITDIDIDRNVIRIRNSKGAKDRDIALPKLVYKMLLHYYKLYTPVTYVFNGKSGEKYSASSAGKILKMGLKKVGIHKRITIHGLRHSYATHLAESHVNLRYIQEALGHSSSKTTEIYTKLSSDHIAKMISPIDKWDDVSYT